MASKTKNAMNKGPAVARFPVALITIATVKHKKANDKINL
jgi:hypothetical protein